MKKYNHFLNEIDGDPLGNGQSHFGVFMAQMVILSAVIIIGLIILN